MKEQVILKEVVLAVLLSALPCSMGWGNEGHYATCKIAQEYLSKEAEVAVKELLPESAQGELAAVCTWPDDVRNQPQWVWSRDLHFADTPDFLCNYEYCRDCHDSAGHKDMCVTGAIHNYTNQLKSAYEQNRDSQVKYNLTVALSFLSHFMGDVHQPLHCGFLGDLGGNRIGVEWYQQRTNLHRVWDDWIIDSSLKRFYDSNLATMIQAIHNNIRGNWSDDISSWESCAKNTTCPDMYASESTRLACQYAYTNVSKGCNLEDDYFLSRRPIVEERLAQGGIRLASTLNRIFVSQPKIAEA